jgi:hypothetical protein
LGDGLFFGGGLGAVDELEPVRATGDRPIAKEGALFGGTVDAAVEAAPAPVLSGFDELGAEGVSFDVAEDGFEVSVFFDDEGFEAALVEGAVTDGRVTGAPALGVGEGEPLHERGEVTVAFGAEDEVPVIWHGAVGEDVEGEAVAGLEKSAFEGEVVLVMAEEGNAGDGAVEDVVDEAAGAAA